MALPSSGSLTFSAIAGELQVGISSPVSFRSLSNTAGFSTPDSFSEFYGYSATPATTSDIQTQRIGSSGNSGTVKITSTSYAQAFQNPYYIVQAFAVQSYNYVYAYYSYATHTANFGFVDTNLNSSRTLYFPVPPDSYPVGTYVSGNPTLSNPNGLPVSLVGWS